MQLPFDKKVKEWRCPSCNHKWTRKKVEEQFESAARKAYNLNEFFVPHLHCDECNVPLCPVWRKI